MARKITFLLTFLFIIQFSYANTSLSTQESNSLGIKKGKKKKNGRYKKRKKLFKRNKDCDCPKH